MAERDWPTELAKVAVRYVEWMRVPAVPSWSRLEPLALTRGDLTPGTQAVVGDPLWMLGRQWQFDELRGEDAGSPVLATVEGESAQVNRFRGGVSGDARDLAPEDPPLETLVEAEVPRVLPLRLRSQMGMHLLRLLRADDLHSAAETAARALSVSPSAPEQPADDRSSEARRRSAAGRIPDGAAVMEALADLDDGVGGLTGVPAVLVGADDPDRVRDVVVAWRAWASTFLTRPSGQSWDPHRLEHRFAAQAGLSDGPVGVHVDEYPGGTLDWFHADLGEGTLGAPAGPGSAQPVLDTSLPAPVRFPGMPSDRLFAFEDAAVYLGGVQAGRTDLARMAVVEFAVAYGVDWFVVPLVLRSGSVTRFDRVRVRDTFGVETVVEPAAEASRPGWAAFRAAPLTDRSRPAGMFLLAPSLPRVLEGEPLEEVALVRDEMSNLVWGVERVVPDPVSGEPVRRATPAARVTTTSSPDDLGDAGIVYRLMTPVPDNWIPFVAVRPDGAPTHELERRPMVRHHADGGWELVHPRGTLLLAEPSADPAADRLRLAEQEVPREGIVLTRSFQLGRTADGGTVLWIGRRARTGTGEASSGLRFDLAHPSRAT